ncbi:MAG TPA: FliH/SctL family protein, partial [Solirubrobacteraceae bacterium]|nr:FliH/SctL family protein [Solirubrobacteraceae bacterium]
MAASAAPFEFAPLEPLAGAGAAPLAGAPAPVPAVDLDAVRAEGFDAGYAAGAADARAAIEPAAAALQAAAAELRALREDTAERCERAAVDLALAIAEQVLQGALAVRPELVVDAVRGALRRLV